MATIGRMVHRWLSALVIAGAVIFASWSASSLQSGVPIQVYPTSSDAKVSAAPTAPSQSTEARTISDPPQVPVTGMSSPSEQPASPNTSIVTYRVDPNVFFPPGRVQGHELARDNCLTCHQLMTFAYVRKTRDGWMRNRANHAGRLPELSEDQIGIIYEYLAATITPDLPIPDIPLDWVCSS